MRRGIDPGVKLTIGGLSNASRMELNQTGVISLDGRGAFGELSLPGRDSMIGFAGASRNAASIG